MNLVVWMLKSFLMEPGITSYLVFLLVLMLIFYSAYFLFIWYTWNKISCFNGNTDNNLPYVSIILATRNEDFDMLKKLCSDISNQNFPKEKMEVFIVDDNSNDIYKHQQVLLANEHEDFSFISLPESQQGKKMALRFAAEKAKGDLLLFTDSDCRVPQGWVRETATYYSIHNPDIVIGMVEIALLRDTLLGRFQQMELISLIVSSFSLAFVGRPVMCNGANLGVRREKFLEVTSDRHHNNERTPSGDDVFLLHSIKQMPDSKVGVLKSLNAVVKTKQEETLKDMIQQRMRWASKSRFYKDKDIISMGIVVFSGNISVVLGLIYSIITNMFWLAGLLFFIKTIADFYVIKTGYEFFNKKRLYIFSLVLFELIYPFYTLIMSIMSLMVPYKWRGRKYTPIQPN